MHRTDPTVRWGILGCARIARLQFVPAIGRSTNATLHAVASRDPARLAEFRNLFGDAFTAHASYEALLADPTVDAVYVPLPNALHCEWAIRAMQNGKHVLCEKPLALDASEAQRMADAAHAHGVQLMEAFMYRYTARLQAVERILASGVLGELRSVNSTFRFFLDRANTIKDDPALGGGALYDVGVYPLNLIGLVAQAEPVEVFATCTRSHGVDHNLSALLRYESGLIASLHCGFNAHGRMHSDIVGSEASLLVPDTFLDDAGEILLNTRNGSERIAVPASDRYAAEVQDFSAAILAGRAPRLTLDESLRNLRVLDRIRAALDA